MRPLIVLFAKAPIPGQVKTRLRPRLEAWQTAELHRAFVRDMLEMLQLLFSDADIELSTDITTDAWREFEVQRSVQTGNDLGSRMGWAIENALASGRPQVVIVGSDAPTLPAAHLRALLASDADVALGPTDDGGYYAIACRRFDAGIFRQVRWSGPDTLESTVRAIRGCGLSVELGPLWFDVDEPDDLDRLAASPGLPRHTEQWLRRCGPK